MLFAEALDGVKRVLSELSDLRGIAGLFFWDQWSGLPAGGRPFRERLEGYIEERRITLLNAPATKSLAEYWRGVPAGDIEKDIDRAMVRSFLFEHRKAANIPLEKARKLVALTGRGREAWMEARAARDYGIFRPVLEEIFALKTELAGHIDPDRPAFEVMVGANDEGISLEDLGREFNRLKVAVSRLVAAIGRSPIRVDDSFLESPVDRVELLRYATKLVETMGYDPDRGGYGEVPHPFTSIVGPKDARITVNCGNFRLGVFGALHEAGHAMYSYRGNPEVDAAGLWGGSAGGFHEAQARFYENMVGKSLEFWRLSYPETQRRFPFLAGVPIGDFHRALNRVRPTLNRITADEVTYSLHPIIRFELERELVEGRISFAELPRAWSDRYEDYLGVRPADDAEGLLQDIHWSVGELGYFQSYSLGNIYAGQIRRALLRAVPDAMGAIEGGDFQPLNEWLTANIHQHGNCFTATEMIGRLDGGSLDAGPFIDYLYGKYAPLYQLAPGTAGGEA